MTYSSLFISICYLLSTLYLFDIKGKESYASPIGNFVPSTITIPTQVKVKTRSKSSQKNVSNHSFQHKSLWALGLMVGQPSGISAQYKLNSRQALQAVLAYGLLQTNLYMGVDYTQNFHRFKSISSDVYWGLGGFTYTYSGLINHNKHNHTAYSSGGLGARMSIGMIYIVPNAPLQVFTESGLRSFVIPHIGLTFDIALGLRYQFP